MASLHRIIRIASFLVLLILTGCAPTDPVGDPIDATLPITDTPNDPPTASPSPTDAPPPTATQNPAFPVISGEIIYRRDNTIRAIGPDGQNDRLLMPIGENDQIAQLSPDQRYMGLYGFYAPSILDLQTGELTRIDSIGTSGFGVEWTPDGDNLIFTGEGDSFGLWRSSFPPIAPPELIMPFIRDDIYHVREFVGVVDNENLLFNERDTSTNPSTYRVFLYNWRTQTEQELLNGDMTVMSLSPDATRLTLARESDIVRIGSTTINTFYIADLSMTDGIQNIQRVIVEGTNRNFAYTPGILPDNQTIIALSKLDPPVSVFPYSAVILTPRGDGTYDERPIVPPDGSGVVWIVRWNQDGTWLVYQRIEGESEPHMPTIWLMPLDGSSPATFFAEGQNPFIVDP